MESTPRRWIVLFERALHGPYTETEVKRLVADGIVNLNSLAHLDQGETAAPPVWRFLWQYPEFDRRRGKKPTKEQAEKRKPVTEEEITQRIRERLKQELPEPEKPAPPPPPPEPEKPKKTKPRKEEAPSNPFAEFMKPSAEARSLKKWKLACYALGAALLVSHALVHFLRKPPPEPICPATSAVTAPRSLERNPSRAPEP